MQDTGTHNRCCIPAESTSDIVGQEFKEDNCKFLTEKIMGAQNSNFYLSHCYSIARDRLQNHFCHTVILSLNTPTAAILIRF